MPVLHRDTRIQYGDLINFDKFINVPYPFRLPAYMSLRMTKPTK